MLNSGTPHERVETPVVAEFPQTPIISIASIANNGHHASPNVIEITSEDVSHGQFQGSYIFFLTTVIRMLYSIVGLY